MALFHSKRWQNIETYALVSVLTVLVWLYAEAETIKPNPVFIQIRFTGSASQLVSPADVVGVSAVFRCTTAQLAHLRALKERDVPFEIEVAAREPGNHQIDLRQGLLDHPRIAELGVAVDRVEPPEWPVTIERLVDATMAVEFDEGPRELAEPAIVVPAQITVKMPSSLEERLSVTKLVARLDEEAMAKVIKGVQVPLPNVPIVVPPELQEDNVTLSQTSVAVTLTIVTQSDTLENWPVPIRLAISDDVTGRFKVRHSDDTVVVDLRGPPDVIERIKQFELDTFAYLPLNLTELDQAVIRVDQSEPLTKQLDLQLPPDVSAYPATPRIEYTVEKLKLDGSTE